MVGFDDFWCISYWDILSQYWEDYVHVMSICRLHGVSQTSPQKEGHLGGFKKHEFIGWWKDWFKGEHTSKSPSLFLQICPLSQRWNYSVPAMLGDPYSSWLCPLPMFRDQETTSCIIIWLKPWMVGRFRKIFVAHGMICIDSSFSEGAI